MRNVILLLVTFYCLLLSVYKFALKPTTDYTVHLQESKVTELGKKFLLFMQPKVHRRVHNGLRLGPVLRQADALKICTRWSSESYSSSSHPPLVLLTQVFWLKWHTHFRSTCKFRPINLHPFDHPNTVWWTAQIIKPLITSSPPRTSRQSP